MVVPWPDPDGKSRTTSGESALSVWWDYMGIIHFELLPKGKTVNSEVYCQQLDRLQEALMAKRPALVNRNGVVLQHDNARPHTSKMTQEDQSIGL